MGPDDKTPTDPSIRRAIEREVKVMGVKMTRLSHEQERDHPPMSKLDPRDEPTFCDETRPPLVADSLRPPDGHKPWDQRWRSELERLVQGAKERARRAEMAVLEVGATNACEHADMKTDISEMKADVRELKAEHPKTLRSTRVWNTVAGVLVAAAAFWGWLAQHEMRMMQHEAAAASASARK